MQTFLSFSILGLSIYKLSNGNKIYIIPFIIGTFSHNAGWVVAIIFFISKFVKIPIIINYLAFLVPFFNDRIIRLIIDILSYFDLYDGYIYALFDSYIYGRHSNIFTVHYNFLHIIRGLTILILTLIIFTFLKRKQKTKNRYFDFISLYLFVVVIFLNYQVVLQRFTILGFIFFIPLYYEFLLLKINNFYKLLYFYFFILIFDYFNFMDYGTRIGIGFPLNIFEPTVSLIFNYFIY